MSPYERMLKKEPQQGEIQHIFQETLISYLENIMFQASTFQRIKSRFLRQQIFKKQSIKGK